MTEPMWSAQTEQPTSTVVLWEGQRESLGAVASRGKLVSAKYKMTEDALQFEAGLLSTSAETVPLWFVVDVDLKQSMTQKARNVGDLHLRIDQAVASRYGQSMLILESVKDPRKVRDLIVAQATFARRQIMAKQHAREIESRQAGASVINLVPPSVQSAPPPPPQPVTPSVIEQLKDLAQLREAGILTDEEFAAQKAKILG
jgi:hypothetical protein